MDDFCLHGVGNLLFDLGGVIMDIRRENCVEALTRLGMEGADEMLGLYSQSGPFMLLEDGRITAAEFRDEVRRRSPGASPSDAEIDAALNAFLIGIPVERLRALETLRKSYGVYMLSNTNPIMFHGKIADEFRKDGKDMGAYFDGVCASFEAGCSKPGREIFEKLVARFGLRPEETLFFDDSEKNLEAARRMGFRTWLVSPGTEFMDAFKQLREE